MSILGQLRKTKNVLAVLGVSGLASRIICACSGSMLLFRFFQPAPSRMRHLYSTTMNIDSLSEGPDVNPFDGEDRGKRNRTNRSKI